MALREEKPRPDLLLEGVPFVPGYWNILVEPLRPKTVSDGGIEIVDSSLQAEEIQTTVGRVLAAGPSSMLGKTTSGIELSDFTDDCKTREQLVGKFVLFQMHVGQRLKIRQTGQDIIVMRSTDLLGITSDPNYWKFYL